ncbi:hypothetical protein EMA8858_03911 [Emticicia aquatica]|jgi:hypothetical protein|uniref:Lipocalin-like domain-containing protein n=1 Tax=Emticicia aquatica TaxID=1681835 RepID=A0ABM9AUP7_9BACT|nr:hypothetical protein [Emticicia aquatica]CAH0997777.1 hypothetical protein EMA8858_03911 [Emticicia aquatica]
MKFSILTFAIMAISLTSIAQKKSPIDGNWILVEKNGQKLNFQNHQFKTYNQGYFSVIILKNDGTFNSAYAGPFSIKGNVYTETYKYGSKPEWFGWTGEQEWKIKGDTLHMVGHNRIIDPEGKEHPKTEWSQFVEKWVRVK